MRVSHVDRGCRPPVAVLAAALWQQLVQHRAAEPKKQPKEESGTCSLRHVDQMTEFCVALGCDPRQTLEIVGVVIWPSLLETELREKLDSLG